MFAKVKDGKLELPKDNFVIEFVDDNKAIEIFEDLEKELSKETIDTKQLLTLFIEKNLENIEGCYFQNLNDLKIDDDDDDDDI